MERAAQSGTTFRTKPVLNEITPTELTAFPFGANNSVPIHPIKKTVETLLFWFFVLISSIYDMWGLIFDLPMILLCVTSKGGSNRRRMLYHNLDPTNRALKSVTDQKVLFA